MDLLLDLVFSRLFGVWGENASRDLEILCSLLPLFEFRATSRREN